MDGKRPVVLKPLDALIAALIAIALIAAHEVLFALSGLIVALAATGGAAYVVYRWFWHHRFETARLERYRFETLRLPGSPYGNYDAIFDPKGQKIIQAEPGNPYPVPGPSSLHYAPHIVEGKGQPLALPAPPEAPAIIGNLALPGPMSMIDVMRGWELSPDNLYLATVRGGRHLATTVDGYMHIAHDGQTGSGKTSQWKAELIMLLKAEVYCFLANPHFTPVTKKGDDWRPIARTLLAQEPATESPFSPLLYDEEQILMFLRWLSEKEITRRFALQRAGTFTYTPMYGFVDEWPMVVERYPKAAEYMGDVLRRGRAVEVFISANSQGFLAEDVGLNDAARKNFLTAYWLGGSIISASRMLNMEQKRVTTLLAELAEEGIKPGKGIGLLRNDLVSFPAQVARLPEANNAYTYYMLGKADGWSMENLVRGGRPVSVEEINTETLAPNTDSVAAQGYEIRDLALPEASGVSRNETTGDCLISDDNDDSVSRETKTPVAFPPDMNNDAWIIEAAAQVGSKEREAILRSIKLGLPFREVSDIAGFGSERYPVFKEVARQMGFDTSKGNPYKNKRK